MTEFVYIGDDKQPPESTTVFGYKFYLNGKPVEVKERFAVEKLRGNKTFLEIPAVAAPEGGTEGREAQESVAVETAPAKKAKG